MATAKLFVPGNSQAVRIPARYRIDATEVEISKRGDELVLRPKVRTAADLFATARALAGDLSDLKRPPQGKARPVPEWD